MDKNEAVVFPKDLSALSQTDLTALLAQANTAFDTLASQEDIDDAGVEQLEQLATGIESVTAALNKVATSSKAQAFQDRVSKARASFEANTAPAVEEAVVEVEAEEPEAKPAPAAKKVSLASVQERAPQIPDNATEAASGLTITAAAPRYGLPTGSRFDSLDNLVDAFQNHAKAQVTTSGAPQFLTVATVHNEFEEVIDGQSTSLRDIEHMTNKLRSGDRAEALVAGGGWCAPSETRYDFFNIACEDGMIDLPTFGVQRGGITFPKSPSLADVFTGTFTNATNPWVWTEADDILAADGTPEKPCVRVICPEFEEERLECYGICLTAGNLTDSAYPEATRNHLSLLMSAHYHAMNQRYIQKMVSLSTSAIEIFKPGVDDKGGSIASDLPDAVALAAQDIRTRFGLCDDDILEVVLPRWAKDAIRGDLARRTGDADFLQMSDADINALFTLRRTRVQWVADWQVRGAGFPGHSAPIVAWPKVIDFMIYPAGTFVRGNGMTLDLGVVRDSVLNATNDHTAAWTEECHLIAKYGHESRLYRLAVEVSGQAGGALTRTYVA